MELLYTAGQRLEMNEFAPSGFALVLAIHEIIVDLHHMYIESSGSPRKPMRKTENEIFGKLQSIKIYSFVYGDTVM